jgi:hypothetical protein
MRYAELFPDPEARHLLDAHILMTEARHFGNLHRQESRLRRQYGQDAKELKELQAQRKKEQDEQEQAKKVDAPKAKTLAAAANGFEFTIPEPNRNPEGADHPVTTASLHQPLDLI